MRYNVIIKTYGQPDYITDSNSRDSKQHVQNHGADICIITNKRGVVVSAAARQSDGTIKNIYYVL